MSDLLDNQFYLSAERIWLCLRSNFYSLSGPAIDLQMMPVSCKKSSIQMKFILILAVNCHIWGTKNPHTYIEKPTHPKRVTVCRRFWSRGIILTFFVENQQEEAVTVNGDRYRMLNEFLFTKIEEEDIGSIWFQQDSRSHTRCFAPCSQNRFISRSADVVWPPRSWDLTNKIRENIQQVFLKHFLKKGYLADPIFDSIIC